MITDIHVMEQIEQMEALQQAILCYQCGMEAERFGGLCSDCLFDNKISLED